MADPLPLLAPLEPHVETRSKVVDLAAYRASHPRDPRDPEALRALPEVNTRPVTGRAAAHRRLMLRYLVTHTRRAAAGRRH